jgi:hypothetical protein
MSETGNPRGKLGAAVGFATYWAAYGGFRALVKSPYLWVSIVITGLAYPFWQQPSWWDVPLQAMPNVLSFSLGGFAICLAFGDEKFRALIAGVKSSQSPGHSPYITFSATFIHFILLQIACIVVALLAKAWHSATSPALLKSVAPAIEIAKPYFWGFGFFLFVYSLMAAIAATMAIFVIVRSFDKYQSAKRP